MNVADGLHRLIDPFARADGPPPQSLFPFARWALAGSGPVLAIAFVVVALAGSAEVVAARFTGWVIDSSAAVGPGAFWGPFAGLIIGGLLFFIVIRPIIFPAGSGITSVVLGPSLFPLVPGD